MGVAFMAGLPRSGSSLALALLDQHPEITVSGTSPLSEIMQAMREAYTNSASMRANDADEMGLRFKGGLAGLLRGWMLQPLQKGGLAVEKSRDWLRVYHTLAEVLEEPPKMVVTVRDLRAVCASMEKLFRANTLMVDPVQSQHLQGLTVAERVAHWNSTLPIGASLRLIQDAITQGYIGACYVLRMEDLCAYPLEEMRALCAYLGCEPYAFDSDHVEQRVQEDDRAYGIPGLHEVRHRVEPDLNDWNEVLGKGLSDQIRNNNPWFYEQFYPERA